MSENTPDDDQTPEGVRNLRAALEREKQRADANEAAGRKLAMIEAGVDLSNPVAELFVSSYSGEMEPDAIKEAASKYGLVSDGTTPPPTPPAEETPEPGDKLQGLQQQQQQLTEGVPPEQLPTQDAVKVIFDEYEKDRQAGLSTEAAQSNFLHRMFAEAYDKKDPRLLLDPSGQAIQS